MSDQGIRTYHRLRLTAADGMADVFRANSLRGPAERFALARGLVAPDSLQSALAVPLTRVLFRL